MENTQKLQVMTEKSGLFVDDIRRITVLNWDSKHITIQTKFDEFHLDCDSTSQAKAIYEHIVKVLYPEPEATPISRAVSELVNTKKTETFFKQGF